MLVTCEMTAALVLFRQSLRQVVRLQRGGGEIRLLRPNGVLQRVADCRHSVDHLFEGVVELQIAARGNRIEAVHDLQRRRLLQCRDGRDDECIGHVLMAGCPLGIRA